MDFLPGPLSSIGSGICGRYDRRQSSPGGTASVSGPPLQQQSSAGSCAPESTGSRSSESLVPGDREPRVADADEWSHWDDGALDGYRSYGGATILYRNHSSVRRGLTELDQRYSRLWQDRIRQT